MVRIGEDSAKGMLEQRKDSGGGAQYLTPALTLLLLLRKSPLQALDLGVQLGLKPTKLRDQTGLSRNNIRVERAKLKHRYHTCATMSWWK